MRLQELFETTEEDRALISLSSAIYAKLQPYIGTDIDYDDEDQELVSIGRIGELFDTSIAGLDPIGIEIQGGEPFLRRADNVASSDKIKISKNILAFWEDRTKSIVLNADYLGTDRMRTTITHELRHALDELKSDSFPPSPMNKDPENIHRYFTPKKKEHRKDDPYSTVQYRAQPAEINARFVEILDVLSTRIIPRAIKSSPDQVRPKVLNDLKHLLVKYEIEDLFPERTQSRDYKRLIKRAIDFIDKELAHNGVFYPKSTPKLG